MTFYTRPHGRFYLILNAANQVVATAPELRQYAVATPAHIVSTHKSAKQAEKLAKIHARMNQGSGLPDAAVVNIELLGDEA